MSLDADALRTSFELVVGRNPDLTLRFYDHLFALHPEARPLFHRSPREAQAKMLAEALAAVLDHLDDAAWLGATLHAMGAKHVGYGVTAPMYGWVGEALLKTLAEAAGDDWTPRVEGAWVGAFGAIRDLMLAGAATA
jgi:hemoglobin-like flavoprotein